MLEYRVDPEIVMAGVRLLQGVIEDTRPTTTSSLLVSLEELLDTEIEEWALETNGDLVESLAHYVDRTWVAVGIAGFEVLKEAAREAVEDLDRKFLPQWEEVVETATRHGRSTGDWHAAREVLATGTADLLGENPW